MVDTFRAVWPVLDESGSPVEWCEDAIDDLPNVLQRSHVRRVDDAQPKVWIANGRTVPGSGGARLVAVAECPGERVDHYATARRAWRQVVTDAL